MEEPLPQPNIPAPQPIPAQENVPEQEPMRTLPDWLPTAGIIIFILIALFALTQMRRNASPATQQSAPTVVPSSRSSQPLSLLATQSAFLSLQASLATLSAQVTALSTLDSALTPPVLDLPLGF